MVWVVYLLEGYTSRRRKHRFYIGSTNDMVRRLQEHRGKKSSFGRLCAGDVTVAWLDFSKTEKESRNRERGMKKLTRKERRDLKTYFSVYSNSKARELVKKANNQQWHVKK